MSSSMRNAVQRRNHKERAQPIGREKWGLLEKHKDYALRAKDHREKRKRLRVLREKAQNRNPDEFHFGMMSSRTVNGVKIGDRGNKALSHEVVMLLKTQDAGYLRTALQKTRLERQKFESSILLEETSEESRVNLLGREDQLSSKKVFVDSQEEQNTYAKSLKKPSIEMEDKESLERDGIEHPFDEEQLEDELIEAEDKKGSISNPSTDREAQKRMLQALKRREEALIVATRELELQRAKMSNTVGGVNKNGVKFKIRERKR